MKSLKICVDSIMTVQFLDKIINIPVLREPGQTYNYKYIFFVLAYMYILWWP